MRRTSIFALAALLLATFTPASAQINTPIPIQVDPVTPEAEGESADAGIATPTFTPQPTQDPARILLEALPNALDVNVRPQPSTEGDPVGTIAYPDQYIVTGRYFRWWRIQFPDAPGGQAYVFEELVTVTGDTSLVPDLTLEEQGTPEVVDAALVSVTQTAAVVLAQPGGAETLAAGTRVISGPVPIDPNATLVGVTPDGASSGVVDPSLLADPNQSGEVLPTFTYPPDLGTRVAAAPDLVEITAEPGALNISVEDGIAPIIPIAVLGGLGLLGLLISLLRR